MSIDPRAALIAHNAARIVSARIAAGHGHSDADTVAAVKLAHEILYEAELAVSTTNARAA